MKVYKSTAADEKCPYCGARAVVKNSAGVWCEHCEKDIYWNDLERGY
jgi:ribosomal protein L37AE/L43A